MTPAPNEKILHFCECGRRQEIDISQQTHRVAREIMDIINYQRENGNLHPDKGFSDKGFSAALCLSDIIKKLKEYGVK